MVKVKQKYFIIGIHWECTGMKYDGQWVEGEKCGEGKLEIKF